MWLFCGYYSAWFQGCCPVDVGVPVKSECGINNDWRRSLSSLPQVMSPDHIQDGQFADAERHQPIDVRRFIQDETLLDWTEEDEDDDEMDEEYDDNRVEDEDWEVAEGDFTKQYNRLRQYVTVRTGNAQGITSSINTEATVAVLPAVNHPNKSISTLAQKKDKTTDQLAALSKYSSRIAKIDQPYVHMGVGINRKGPSAHANLKDKSDRATNEQVLDPRTRIILFKMIGRELIHEVNGCISTGKEVGLFPSKSPCSDLHIFRQMFITPSRPHLPISLLKFTKPPSSHSKIAIGTSRVNIASVVDIAGGILERWFDYGQRRN